jgi:hypothetical protein
LTGWTVVTRDPEWDDVEREKMQALEDYEADVCECGLHKSVADQDPDLEFVYRKCPTCAGIAQQMRAQEAIDEEKVKNLGEHPAPEADRPTDGRHVALRLKLSAD